MAVDRPAQVPCGGDSGSGLDSGASGPGGLPDSETGTPNDRRLQRTLGSIVHASQRPALEPRSTAERKKVHGTP